ncbi:hypothetical protein CDG77_19470, partial [Nostoc sp. 'Peltigera membranacea cyanobiont' 213]|uniref:hypothetical protein n=1 Tax=Nostoc sp. 'Peltigera membranacea cyanobiont' 213 TaxID=2014530 RepID=UPI000B9F2B1C
GILPVPNIRTGKMPIPQENLGYFFICQSLKPTAWLLYETLRERLESAFAQRLVESVILNFKLLTCVCAYKIN